ncbi:WD40-repeat-containing domain protein [Mrakia frigida]|uniref:WD40 repeat domain-containing protein n=1 Tax=Mrakia frigida TaxID=29902 RepID=UPI003FCC20E3
MNAPDPEIPNPSTDSISTISFSPNAPILAVGSWSREVRFYEVNSTGQSQMKGGFAHEGPVLDLCWVPDGSKLISVGADKAARMFDLGSGQATQVAAHDAPIRSCRYGVASNGSSFLITGGWDRSLKFWDLRSPNPIGQVHLPERCYTMDTTGDVLVVGTAERHIQLFDLRNPATAVKSIESPLKWQTRVISCFPSTTKPGYAVGSIEGRIAYNVIPAANASETFSFKCHRAEAKLPRTNPPKPTLIYSVNSISFHKTYGTFASAGGDGLIHIWDASARSRLKTLNPTPNLATNATPTPIVSTSFSSDHSILAWAQSYDWSRGHAGATNDMVNRIGLHLVKDDEVKGRAK